MMQKKINYSPGLCVLIPMSNKNIKFFSSKQISNYSCTYAYANKHKLRVIIDIPRGHYNNFFNVVRWMRGKSRWTVLLSIWVNINSAYIFKTFFRMCNCLKLFYFVCTFDTIAGRAYIIIIIFLFVSNTTRW